MTTGRSIRLFLVDGSPSGLITAEIPNWTGHVLTGPRSLLSELVARPEARGRTGIYFLVGQGDVLPQLYIGESNEIDRRLQSHAKAEAKGGKDFWERVCLVTSKDENLTTGHTKYLESRFISLATQAGRCELVNSTSPTGLKLPEADLADMEFFISQVQTLLPVLGMEFLKAAPRASKTTECQPEAPVFTASLKKEGISATMQLIEGEFVVLAGSLARSSWTGVATNNYRAHFEALIASGILQPTDDGRHLSFTRDYAFSSPSAAAAVVFGRSANGLLSWLAPDGRNYGEWASSIAEG